MRLPTYDSYQETNFDFFGKIPTSWKMKRTGHHVDFITGFAFKSDKFSFENGIKLVRGDNVTEGNLRWGDKTRYWSEVTKDLNQYLLQDKDILIGMDGSKVGKNYTIVSESDLPLLLVQRVARLRTDPFLNHRFLAYLIGSELFRIWTTLVKTDPAIPHISPADIRGFPLPYPTIYEQQKITNFLDHETSKIDTLIANQVTLIELLKEKRQAVISHAVTRGINTDDPMKDSGIEWLGEVPEHWTIGKLKNVLRIKNGKDYKHVEVEVAGYPVYGSGGIFKRSSDYLYDGTSVLFGRKGTVDKPLLVTGKFWTVDTMFYSEIFNNAIAEYILSQATLFPFDLLSTNTALPSMTQEDLLQLGFVIPPREEQKAIIEFIESKNSKFDLLLAKATHSIQLMKERKIAIISAAVTGKIDVRHFALK